MAGPNVREYDKRLYKKCIKCRSWRPRKDIKTEDGVVTKKGFGAHNSSDGLQSICHSCKNSMNTTAREKNVTQRIRHHTATRCTTQLGKSAPAKFVKDLEEHLGYKIKTLVRHLSADLKNREGHTRKLRDALNEGYHIDHVRPLSSFSVVRDSGAVDWEIFRECWDITNLSAIPAAENLAKGAKRTDLELDATLTIEQESHDASTSGKEAREEATEEEVSDTAPNPAPKSITIEESESG